MISNMLLNRWLIKVVVQNCSCDVMGTCMTTGQYYPILNAYLRELEIDVSGAKQGETISNEFFCNLRFVALKVYFNCSKLSRVLLMLFFSDRIQYVYTFFIAFHADLHFAMLAPFINKHSIHIYVFPSNSFCNLTQYSLFMFVLSVGFPQKGF